MPALSVWIPSDEGDDAFVAHLRASVPAGVEIHATDVCPTGVSPQVLVRGVVSADDLAACPDLAHVVIPYAGVPEPTRQLLGGRPELALHNIHHNAASTAELAIALLLAVVKQIIPHDRDLRAGDWRRRYAIPTTATLAGRSALVLGYGAIGQRVTHILTALGLRVSAVRRHAADGDRHGMVSLAPMASLPRLLPHADVLIVCLPLTDETRGILDAPMLRMLPRRAYLVNVGRGALVDERALYECLLDGHLAGAGLDVWYRYPKSEAERKHTLPAAHPLHELEHVVLSPHRAGLTRDTEGARARAVAEVLAAILTGGEVPGRVDCKAGY